MKIVVAEDDKNYQTLIAYALGPLCEQIATVDTVEALLAALTPDVDLVWMDLGLFRGDAKTTIQAIPQVRKLSPSAATIVVTGWNETYRKEALEAGADLYVHKDNIRAFSQSAMVNLLSRAALSAMNRGIAAHKILATVAKFVAEQNTT